MLSGSYEFLAQDRVIFGRPAAEAVLEAADRMGNQRVLIIASKTFSRKTDVVGTFVTRSVSAASACSMSVEYLPRASVGAGRLSKKEMFLHQ